MADLSFPTSSTPGRLAGEGGGRLVNAFAETLGGRPIWRRVAGLSEAFVVGLNGLRGMLDVGGELFVAYPGEVARVTAAGTVTSFAGLPGTDAVFWARNNRTSGGAPATDVVACRASGGAYAYNSGVNSMVPYPDADLPATANSASFLGGYFLFTVSDGRIFASGLNTTTVDALSFATAESSSDALLRGIVWGGLFYAMGAETIEPWLNQGLSPFPLQRATSVIPVGLLSAAAVAGHESGWGFSPFFVASDYTVRELQGYDTRVVSTLSVQEFIAASDITTLEASVYTVRGRAFWCLSSNIGTWELNVVSGAWHERKSAGQARWRGTKSVKLGSRWLVGDTVATGRILAVDDTVTTEFGDAVTWQVESAPTRAFPARVSVPGAIFDFSPVAGVSVKIEWSHDGGIEWDDDGEERNLLNGAAVNPVRQNRLGEASQRGISIRLTSDDAPDFSFMGGSLFGEQPRAPG